MNAQLNSVVSFSTQQHHAFHARLARFNSRRFIPATPSAGWQKQLTRDMQSQVEEGDYIESERIAAQSYLTDLPADADGFMRWFEALRNEGPGQNGPLFPWLATAANMPQMRWFLGQEVAGEAGFDDLVALTQVRFPVAPKLEMARNYWDEMGRGHEHGMHGGMLVNTAREFDLRTEIEETVWEALALANVMAGLAANRRYAFHSIGALGVIEMTAPGRPASMSVCSAAVKPPRIRQTTRSSW